MIEIQNKIDRFTGEYFFLSNFYLSSIIINNIDYRSVEHYFQSMKGNTTSQRNKIRNAKTPADAKKLGKQVKLDPKWYEFRDRIMYYGVYSKFSQNLNLKQRLLNTCPLYLEEGNTWNDVYWGVCNGQGENKLGRILMHVRNLLK